MEQDHSEIFQKFESGISRCKECGGERSEHTLTLNCPALETRSTKKCFNCRKLFSLEYVLAKGDHSLKNNWDYWTENEENKGKYICNTCLLKLYREDKKQYLQEVKSKKKRQLFRVYVYDKTIE